MNGAFVVVLLSLITFSENVKLPSNFQKCNRNQPDLKECVLKAAQDGIYQLTKPYEEVNIVNVNPFQLPEATIGAGSGTVAVEQKFKDCQLYGLNKFKLEKFEFDFDKKVLSVIGTFPEVVKKCQYELDGKVLLLPVRGKGPSTVTLKNLYVTAQLRYQETKKKSKTYIKIVSSDITLDPEHMTYNFENLFDGDKRLGDNIHQVLNDNWKEVFEDVKGGYIEIIKSIVTSLLNSFFSKVSMEEAFD